MREFASCVNEYAVQVWSETSCSSYTNNSCISPNFIPSTQNSVACLYKALLPNKKQLMITVTWSKTASSQGLTVNFDHPSAAAFKINTTSRLFRKSKGCKSLHLRSSKIDLFWDLSTARYRPAGPEPLDTFYLIVVVDSHPALVLGDKDIQESLKSGAKFALVSRQEHFSGNKLYSTKAQFSEAGGAHDILIRCSGEGGGEGKQHPILWVCIDKKMVIRVRKLQWNFRGNETILLDGLVVDLMWDVHDWFYNPDSTGFAVFMFRTRTGLWLDQNEAAAADPLHFSFIIYAC